MLWLTEVSSATVSNVWLHLRGSCRSLFLSEEIGLTTSDDISEILNLGSGLQFISASALGSQC